MTIDEVALTGLLKRNAEKAFFFFGFLKFRKFVLSSTVLRPKS